MNFSADYPSPLPSIISSVTGTIHVSMFLKFPFLLSQHRYPVTNNLHDLPHQPIIASQSSGLKRETRHPLSQEQRRSHSRTGSTILLVFVAFKRRSSKLKLEERQCDPGLIKRLLVAYIRRRDFDGATSAFRQRWASPDRTDRRQGAN